MLACVVIQRFRVITCCGLIVYILRALSAPVWRSWHRRDVDLCRSICGARQHDGIKIISNQSRVGSYDLFEDRVRKALVMIEDANLCTYKKVKETVHAICNSDLHGYEGMFAVSTGCCYVDLERIGSEQTHELARVLVHETAHGILATKGVCVGIGRMETFCIRYERRLYRHLVVWNKDLDKWYAKRLWYHGKSEIRVFFLRLWKVNFRTFVSGH